MRIAEVNGALQPSGAVIDLFSGISRVGHGLKERGYRVVANDLNGNDAGLARTYVQSDREDWAVEAQRHLEQLARLPPEPGYLTRTSCEERRSFQPHNGARNDAIREVIARRALHPELEAILLTSLMEAGDRVDATTGVRMAFLKLRLKKGCRVGPSLGRGRGPRGLDGETGLY